MSIKQVGRNGGNMIPIEEEEEEDQDPETVKSRASLYSTVETLCSCLRILKLTIPLYRVRISHAHPNTVHC